MSWSARWLDGDDRSLQRLGGSPVGLDSVVVGSSNEGTVALTQEKRLSGTYVIGVPESGKTTLLQTMALQDMIAGLGLCIIEPHSDMIPELLDYIPENRLDDVILLDVADEEHPFGLNVFDCQQTGLSAVSRSASQFVNMMKTISEIQFGRDSWGPRLYNILNAIAYTMQANQAYTFADVPRLLYEDDFRQALVRNIEDPITRMFWEYQYPKGRMQREYRDSTMLRIQPLLSNPLIHNIVSQSVTSVDFRKAMDQRKIILIKLAVGEVGSEPTALLGAMFVNQILNAALSRGDSRDRPQFNLYADEYHLYATPDFGKLVVQARKYGVATTMAHQGRFQLTDYQKEAAIQCANLIVLQVSGSDSQELAIEFQLKREPQEGRWVQAFDSSGRPLTETHVETVRRWEKGKYVGESKMEYWPQEMRESVYEWQDGGKEPASDALAEQASALRSQPIHSAYIKIRLDNKHNWEGAINTIPIWELPIQRTKIAEQIREKSRIEFALTKGQVAVRTKKRDSLPAPVEVKVETYADSPRRRQRAIRSG